jgi:arylsulfatase A-like enzyme
MKRRVLELVSAAMRWHLFALTWLLLLVACAVLIVFRGIKNSSVAQMIQFQDVPLLHWFNQNYASVYDLAAVTAGTLVLVQSLVCFLVVRRAMVLEEAGLRNVPGGVRGLAITGWGAWLASLLLATATLVASDYVSPEDGTSVIVPPTRPLDWLAVVAAGAGGVLLVQWIARLWDDRLPLDETLGTTADQAGMAPPLDTSPLAEDEASVQPARGWGTALVALGVVYLLCCASIVVYAWRDHVRFWDIKENGGFDYGRFFLPEESAQADLVLYSTSLLFASIAASLGCLAYLALRWLVRSRHRQGTSGVARLALLVALVWAVVGGVPWQARLWPEIRAENGWIMPAVILVFSVAGLAPLILVSGLMLRRDFLEAALRVRYVGFTRSVTVDAQRCPRPIELALWMLLLFPVYPYLRFFRLPWARANYTWLMLMAATLVAGGTLLVNKVDEWFTFEDWRSMLRVGQLPSLRVFLSLLSAAWLYACGRRLIRWKAGLLREWLTWPSRASRAIDEWVGAPRLLTPMVRLTESASTGRLATWIHWPARLTIVLAAGVCLTFALWPFWGWHQVPENVFTRLAEYNGRHQFELGVLHWIFDFDRDGYAAVLHGADEDDFDPGVQAGGIAPAEEAAAVPIDEFAVADPQKAKDFPNVVLLFLEGVVPRALSCYGYRQVPGGIAATPHIDSVAADGTRFTQCRCYYPSTWDAWFSTMSGRFLRIAEFDASIPFGDRYSRYANMYQVLKLGGIQRWCHPDCAPFPELFVPPDLHASAWKPDSEFSSALSEEERNREVWLGDKRAQRLVDFIDSIKPGEKFFLCEHMSDTHFPWKRTGEDRAKELGFPNGLGIYESDADLVGPTGEKYRTDQFCCYYQTITRMDAQVGLVLGKLKQKGLYDNTAIVIVSDHGCQFWEHEHLYYVARIYEQALLVPLIVRVPGVPGNRVCHETVLQTDILATVMDLAGVRLTNPRDDYPMTNHTLMPLLGGTATDDDRRRYRQRDVPLTTHFDRHGVISNFEYKLIFDRTTGTCSLFSLTDDLRKYGPELVEAMESRNLVDERPELKKELLAKLRKLLLWNKSIIGQIERSRAE